MYRKEAPWESAQKELLKINAYKVTIGTVVQKFVCYLIIEFMRKKQSLPVSGGYSF